MVQPTSKQIERGNSLRNFIERSHELDRWQRLTLLCSAIWLAVLVWLAMSEFWNSIYVFPWRLLYVLRDLLEGLLYLGLAVLLSVGFRWAVTGKSPFR